MILYLRNDKGKNLLDLEVWVKVEGDRRYVELSSNINITNYSHLLLDNVKNKTKIIHDFDNLSELRGWLWERYFMTGKNDGSQIDDVIQKLKIVLTKVAKDYNLDLIED
jgi:hypothetical protein